MSLSLSGWPFFRFYSYLLEKLEEPKIEIGRTRSAVYVSNTVPTRVPLVQTNLKARILSLPRWGHSKMHWPHLE